MSVVTPSGAASAWTSSAILSMGAMILVKRVASALVESRTRSAALEISRRHDLIRDFAARR